MVFDTNTGSFLNQVGALGQAPEEYSDLGLGSYSFWVDRSSGDIYAHKTLRGLLKFDIEGRFLGCFKPEWSRFPHANIYSCYPLLRNDTALFYNNEYRLDSTFHISRFLISTGELIDTIATFTQPIHSSLTSPVSMRVGMELILGSQYLFSYGPQNDRLASVVPFAPSIWEFKGQLSLKEAYIDTIYTLERYGKKLLFRPSFVLNLGKYHIPYDKRFDLTSINDGATIDFVLEGEKYLYIHFYRKSLFSVSHY